MIFKFRRATGTFLGLILLLVLCSSEHSIRYLRACSQDGLDSTGLSSAIRPDTALPEAKSGDAGISGNPAARDDLGCVKLIPAGVPGGPAVQGGGRGRTLTFGFPIPGRKVLVEAYFPFNEDHRHIREFIENLPSRFGGRVVARAKDFRDDDGYFEWRGSGSTCGVIFVDKVSSFEITGQTKTRGVRFERAMGELWTGDDLVEVVQIHLDALDALKSGAAGHKGTGGN